MHRFHSKSSIIRFKFAAFCLCLKCLLTPVAVGILIYSLIVEDRELTLIAAGVGATALLMLLAQWLVTARCPLCRMPVLAASGCSKHRNARTFLGSHRLRVALAVLFKGSFLCPYCNEATALKVRTRRY